VIALSSSFAAAAPVAFAAGIISFLSPCVFPLLPSYLAFLGGVIGNEGSRAMRGRAVMGAMAFVAGFTVVFLMFGYLFGGLGRLLHQHQRGVEVVFGVVTVVLGAAFAGWLPLAVLQRERRSHFLPRATVAGAFILGFFFAVGWTPCIGPTLTAILGMAASSDTATAWRGTSLALVYCLGLGIPFVVFAVAGEWASGVSQWLRRRSHRVARIGGLFLILLGLAQVFGLWHDVVRWMQDLLPTVEPPL
jgi:cytochrome c-type biogenesis protein